MAKMAVFTLFATMIHQEIMKMKNAKMFNQQWALLAVMMSLQTFKAIVARRSAVLGSEAEAAVSFQFQPKLAMVMIAGSQFRCHHLTMVRLPFLLQSLPFSALLAMVLPVLVAPLALALPALVLPSVALALVAHQASVAHSVLVALASALPVSVAPLLVSVAHSVLVALPSADSVAQASVAADSVLAMVLAHFQASAAVAASVVESNRFTTVIHSQAPSVVSLPPPLHHPSAMAASAALAAVLATLLAVSAEITGIPGTGRRNK